MSANAGGENSPTPDDDAARRRELIGLCAAKTAGLTGAKAQRYARAVRNSLILRPRPQARGTARPAATGMRLEFLRQAGPFILVPIVGVAAALSIPQFWIQSLFIAVIVLAFGLPIRLAQLWNWREQLRAAEPARLPEAGASIRVDADNLTVGATSLPWTEVRLEAAELRYLWQPRIAPIYRVDQLRLATGKGLLLFDARLIENGREVLDTICDKLVFSNQRRLI